MMNSVRNINAKSKNARSGMLWFLLMGMFFLGGCSQTENGLQSGAIVTQKEKAAQVQDNENYGYFAEIYSLKNYNTNVGCVVDSNFYYVEEEYTMNEEGQIQRISTLYEADWQQGSTEVQENIAREIGKIDASVRYIAADNEGKLYLLTEKWQDEEALYGISIWMAESISLEECPIQFPRGMEAMDGVVFLWDGSRVCAFNVEGQLVWEFAETEILDICPGSDSLWVCLRTNQGNGTTIVEMDAQEGNIKQRWDDISPYDIEQIAWKADGELWLLNSRTGIASCQLDTDTYEQVFSWMDAGAVDIQLNNVTVVEDQICVFARDRVQGKNQIYKISYGELPKEEDKQEIVFAMQWMDEVTKRAIVEFNRTHSEYRIVAKTCTEQEYYDDYRKKIDMEITAGKGADIFILPDESYENYRSKGLLLDLSPYFVEDNTVDMDGFVEKALERYRIGESLYAVPTGFVLSTAVGRQGALGERQSWTFGEMMQAVNVQPQIDELLCGGYKEDVLLYCCRGMLAREDCGDFGGDMFLRILEFANQYGRDAESISTDNEMYHLMTEESLLMEANFADVESVALYKALLNSEISVVGYPSSELTSGYLHASNVLAIRADSPYAEQAWEFVKLLLSESYQKQQDSFPVLETVLEERLKEAMRGEVNDDSVLSGIIVDGEYLEVMSPTTQDAELIQKLIAESKPYPYQTDIICDIVLEEAVSYFAGQKTASEVARIIQNRVQLYLDEGAQIKSPK